MTTTQNSTVTGTKAIELAERLGLTLSKYADPTEGARAGLTVAEAREIAAEDPSLIYLVLTEEHARRLGAEDGAEDVDTVLDEQGFETVRATLQPGHVGWDEGAINAGVAALVGIPEGLREAYYEAYAEGGRKRAEEVATAAYEAGRRVMYKIETRTAQSNGWTDHVGALKANSFASRDDAWLTIEALRALGAEWAEARYRVVEA